MAMFDPSQANTREHPDAYRLDVPKHPLYLLHEQAQTLDQLVTPSPQEIQAQLQQAYAEIRALDMTPLFCLHAESMQTEKTKNMKLFAWSMQEQGQTALFVIPQNGIGDANQQGEHPEAGFIISRAFPERRTPALVLTSNSLHHLVAQLACKGITPATNQWICIDEVQLCTEQTPLQAVTGLLELQQAGFAVIVNGIDYDFKADIFSHMHHLLLMSRFLPGWRAFQLATLCRHCGRPARGSRRVITFPDGHQEIADSSSPIVMPGLSDYYAVCDTLHKSCTRSGLEQEHRRPPLPTELSQEEILEIPWMRETLAHFAISL